MTVNGHTYTKRAEAGARLKELLAERLDATAPETTTPLRTTGMLGGLTVASRTTTVVEDEIRLVVPDAHIELVYSRSEWQVAEPSAIVTRTERQLQRLPEALSTTRQEATAARAEADRAHARIGQPFEHIDDLAKARRRQKEIDEALAVAIEAPAAGTQPTDAPSTAPGTGATKPALPQADLDLTRNHLDRAGSKNRAHSRGLSL
jgi:hypothetical protein